LNAIPRKSTQKAIDKIVGGWFRTLTLREAGRGAARQVRPKQVRQLMKKAEPIFVRYSVQERITVALALVANAMGDAAEDDLRQTK